LSAIIRWFGQAEGQLIHGLRQFSSTTGTHRQAGDSKVAFKFLVDRVSDECDKDVGFSPATTVMIYPPDSQIGLGYGRRGDRNPGLRFHCPVGTCMLTADSFTLVFASPYGKV